MKRRATVICERDGRLLLVARARGRWAFPGGRVKLGEELANAAIRELLEETQLVAETVHYAFQFRGFRTRHYVFMATVSDDAEAVPSNEISRSKWVRPEALRRIEASVPTKGIAEIFIKQVRGSRGTPLREAIDRFAA